MRDCYLDSDDGYDVNYDKASDDSYDGSPDEPYWGNFPY